MMLVKIPQALTHSRRLGTRTKKRNPIAEYDEKGTCYIAELGNRGNEGQTDSRKMVVEERRLKRKLINHIQPWNMIEK